MPANAPSASLFASSACNCSSGGTSDCMSGTCRPRSRMTFATGVALSAAPLKRLAKWRETALLGSVPPHDPRTAIRSRHDARARDMDSDVVGSQTAAQARTQKQPQGSPQMSSKASHDIGWIGLGRMGEAMAARLVKAGHGLSVWNRTASKADPLAQIGAEVVTDKAAMAHCATVFTMVSTTDDLKDILFGKGGVLSGNARPKRVVDMSSISDTGSVEIRKGLAALGVGYLSAPVSGNARVARAGKLLVV